MTGMRIDSTVMRAELSTGPAATWEALTDPSLVERWFTKATPVGAVGDPYSLDFGTGEDAMNGTVVEVSPGHRLSYSWGWGETPAERQTRVTWDLEPLADGGTLLTLTHGGWAEAGLTAADRDAHEEYWEQYVAALVELADELAGIERPD